VTGERRRHPRQTVSLDCIWEGSPTRVSDLSLGGCYIESHFRAPDLGTQTEVILFSSGGPMRIRGEVMHAQRGMGFAMRFRPLEASIATALRVLLGDGLVGGLPA
jgi:hypothetical protein